jgi:hypothetical protein
MLIVGCCFNVDFVGLVRTSCGDYDLSLIEASPHLYPPTCGECNKGNNSLLLSAWDGQCGL